MSGTVPVDPSSPPDDDSNGVEQPAPTNTRMTPSGLPVSPRKPKCSPPLNPLNFPASDWDRETQPTALPMPKTEKLNGASRSGVPSAEWQLYPEGDDALLKELFPEPTTGKPFELQEALRAMYVKQDHLERRFEHCINHIMEHLQQRLALDISEQLNCSGFRPMQVKLQQLPERERGSQSLGGLGTLSRSRSISINKKRASMKAAARRSRSPSRRAPSVAVKSQSMMPQAIVPRVSFDDGGTESFQVGRQKSETELTATQKRASIQGELSMIAQDMDKYRKDADKRDQLRKQYTKKKSKKRGAKSKKSQGVDGADEEESILSRIVHHPLFDTLCAIMILLNSVLIGVTVEHMTKNPEEESWMTISGHACNIFFLIELCLRMSNAGVSYFTCDGRTWNIFDFILVAFSVIDVIMSAIIGEGASSIGSGMKTIKMLRIVRIFRVFRFFRELSLLALMIADSIKSLAWAGLMLMIIIYVFAICFTQSCLDFLKLEQQGKLDYTVSDSVLRDVRHQFGSLSKTIYFLILAMLGGISWGEVSDTLMEVDDLSTFLFFFYIAFTLLAVLNIITGVFVDNAVETARTQRDFLAQKELELREKYVAEMRELFHEMDEDGSGTVSWEEMDDHFSDARVRGYFAALGIDPDDMSRLFQLIDDDNSGEVEVDEFLDGCLRLKGEAKSIDVHTVLHECRKVNNRLEDVLLSFGLLDPERTEQAAAAGLQSQDPRGTNDNMALSWG